MSWVFAQDIKPSSRKFILLALADCMNDEEGCAYPSVCTLELKTCLDRKTVIEGIQDLISQGYLIDTEQRVGRTKQVRVLRLNGLPSLKNHYVYKVTRQDTGEFYIGCRSSFETPERDEYFGSGSWPMQMARARVPLLKVIMGSFAARYEAECFEAQTIQRLIGDPLCRNSRKSAAITNGRFNSPENGTVSVEQQSRFSDETVPLFPLKGPAFSVKGPENGTRNHQEPLDEPLKEPITNVVATSTLTPEQLKEKATRLKAEIAGWFARRPTTTWTAKEDKALIAVVKLRPSVEDVNLLRAYYTRKWPEGKDYRRRNIETLLNNWNGELDRARRLADPRQPEGNFHDRLMASKPDWA